jgi:hypothetical protein
MDRQMPKIRIAHKKHPAAIARSTRRSIWKAVFGVGTKVVTRPFTRDDLPRSFPLPASTNVAGKLRTVCDG